MLADRLGDREAFIGEHLMDSAETITSCLAFIANLADACPSIVFGTGVLPLTNYHPAMAAAQIAMVDHMVQGRLVLDIGPGVSGDAEAIGDLGSDRNRKSQEALEHICQIWSNEPPYQIEGEFYQTTTERSLDRTIGVGVAVRPHQLPHPLIPVAGGWRLARSIFVADDEATARRYAHREDGAHGFYFHTMRTKLAKAGALDVMRDYAGQPDSELATKRCIERLVIAGTPKSVTDQILALRNEVGGFGTLLYTGHDWANPALARRSMELMEKEIWPRVNCAAN